jgi:transcriptional regulator with XRE-family HTH domain
MAVPQRKEALDVADAARKPRNDPERLKAFAQRLNVMLGELGLPQRGRAKLIKERVGVSGTTAANWLRGESYPSFEELARLGRLGVDPTRLFPDTSGLVTAATTPSSSISKRLARLIESEQVVVPTHLKTGDGEWDHVALPNRIWQQLLGRPLTGFIVLFMKGDSMGERIKDGTALLVDTRATQIAEDNAIYALLIGEALLVRRIQRRLQGGYLITCDNPAMASETLDEVGSHDEEAAGARDVLVLGRVALAIQRL